MCTDPMSSVMDTGIYPSMDTHMFYVIAACGKVFTHTHTHALSMNKGNWVFLVCVWSLQIAYALGWLVSSLQILKSFFTSAYVP